VVPSTTLFADPFSTANSSDIDLNNVDRQTGLFAPANYLEPTITQSGGSLDSLTQVNNSVAPDSLLMGVSPSTTFHHDYVSPNVDFGGVRFGFNHAEVTVTPLGPGSVSNPNIDHWAALVIGAPAGTTINTAGTGILIRKGGTWQLYDRGTSLAYGNVGVSTTYKLAFDVVPNTAQFTVSINGHAVFSGNHGGAYSQNYVTMEDYTGTNDPGYQFDYFSGFLVTGVPESSSAALDLGGSLPSTLPNVATTNTANTAPGPFGVVLGGSVPSGGVGYSVTDVGDVNGDGFDDFLIGAPAVSINSAGNVVQGGSATSSVYLVYGSLQVNTTTVSNVDWLTLNPTGQRAGDLGQLGSPNGSQIDPVNGTPSFAFAGVRFITSSNPHSMLGSSVSVVRNINGGNALLIGAPGSSDINGGNPGTGKAYLVYCNAALNALAVASATPGVTQTVNLNNPGATPGIIVITFANLNVGAAHTGASVAGVGDVITDGIPDIAIGAPDAQVGGSGLTNTGAVYLISGAAIPAVTSTILLTNVGQSILTTPTPVPGVLFLGTSAAGLTGFSVADGGDVNGALTTSGQAIDDLLIGAPGTGAGGTAYLVYGAANLLSLPTANANKLFFISLGALGTAVSGVNGAIFNGLPAGSNTGWSVASAGDFNSDGFGDILIGSPGNGVPGLPGQASIIYGSAQTTANYNGVFGTIDLASPPSTVLSATLTGPAAGSLAGYAVSSLGRLVNASNFPKDNLLIGAPGFNANQGAVYLIPGNSVALLGTFTLSNGTQPVAATEITITNTVGTPFFGASISGGTAASGQTTTADNDNLSDFIIGAPGYNISGVTTGSSNRALAGGAFILEGAFIPVNIPSSPQITTPITTEIGVGTPFSTNGVFTVNATTPQALQIFVFSNATISSPFAPVSQINLTSIEVNGVAFPNATIAADAVDENRDGIPDAIITISPRSNIGLITNTLTLTIQGTTFPTGLNANKAWNGTASIIVPGSPSPTPTPTPVPPIVVTTPPVATFTPSATPGNADLGIVTIAPATTTVPSPYPTEAPITTVTELTPVSSFGGDIVRIEASPGGAFGNYVYAISRGAGGNVNNGAANRPGVIYRVDPATGKTSVFFDLNTVVTQLNPPSLSAANSGAVSAASGLVNWYDLAFDSEGYWDGKPSLFIATVDRANPDLNAVYRVAPDGTFMGVFIQFTSGQPGVRFNINPTSLAVPPPQNQQFLKGLFTGSGSTTTGGAFAALFFNANQYAPGQDISSATLPFGVSQTNLTLGPQVGMIAANPDYLSQIYSVFTDFGIPAGPGVPAEAGVSGVQGSSNGEQLIQPPATTTTTTALTLDQTPAVTTPFRRFEDVAFDKHGYFSQGIPSTTTAGSSPSVYASSLFVADLGTGLEVTVTPRAPFPTTPIQVPVQGPGLIGVTTDAAGNVVPIITNGNTTGGSNIGGRILRITPSGEVTVFAENFDTSGAQDSTSFIDSSLSIAFSADGTRLYASDDQAIWQFAISVAPPRVSSVPFTTVVNQAVNSVQVATFMVANPAGVPLSYSTAVSWGDGETSVGTVTAEPSVPGGYTVTASKPHPYANAGVESVAVSVIERAGSQAPVTATASSGISVLKATPTIAWPSPSDIPYGIALGGAQLDATASVPGVFTYTPAAGTILPPGRGQILSVTFIPGDTVDYAVATSTTTIDVNAATPTPTPTQAPTPTLTPSPTATPAPTPPQVVAIAPVASRKGLTSITVSYNEPLNSDSASNSVLYHVFATVTRIVKKRKQTLFTKALAILSVNPNSSGNIATINLARPFKGTVKVTVQGTVTAANGATNNVDSSTIVK
jgi:hypothetical protein